MNTRNADLKLTDELERRLIQEEIDGGLSRENRSAGLFVLELVVGTLLLLGSLLIFARM